MSGALLTESDLANLLRVTESQARDMRRANQWPCVRLSRKTIRYTPEQVEQIIASHATTPERETRLVAPSIDGQTALSRRRRGA